MISNKTYIKAFSLIELLLVIVLIAVILLVVQPSWQGMVSKNHAQVYTNELMMTLQFARATAIKLGEPVMFCCSKDHQKCNGLWRNSSIVVTTVGKPKVLRILPLVFAGDTLSWNRDATITFSPDGFAGGQNRSFYYCPKNSSKNALAVILSPSGRARVSPETSDGKRIPCNF
ncbi:type IV fimbrial biogenesis protein FimT [Gammaproteobacteria bacterium]